MSTVLPSGLARPIPLADGLDASYWLGTRALELGLVDQLGTSDDYLVGRAKDAKVFKLEFKSERGLRERIGKFATKTLMQLLQPQREYW